ncbi:MAG: TetR family transcriptional regulator [Alphaproteobacteria bacterium]
MSKKNYSADMTGASECEGGAHDLKERIALASLTLAEARGWEQVALHDIALACGLSLRALHDVIDCKDDILVLFGRMVDRRMLEQAQSGGEDEGSVRERIFDRLMDRYEILNDYRPGLVAVARSLKYDPKQALVLMPRLCRSMSWVLESVGIGTSSVSGALKVAGLTGVYIKGLKVWMEDESPDLSKTMATLDKALKRSEEIFNRFGA